MRTEMLLRLLVFAVSLHYGTSGFQTGEETCPMNCTCHNHSDARHYSIVDCWRNSIPDRFPSAALAITLHGVRQNSIIPGTFLNLKYLKNLTFSNSCIGKILDGSLSGLENLEYLWIRGSCVTVLRPLAFASFTKIKHIDLSYNEEIGLDQLTPALHHIQNSTSLVILELSNVNNRKLGTILKSNFFKALEHTKISYISLSHNEIAVVETDYARFIPFLETLVLSYNVVSGEYQSFYEVFTLQNLRYLDISYQELKNVIIQDKLNPRKRLKRDGIVSLCMLYPVHLETIVFNHFKALAINCEPWTICPNNSVKYLDMSSIKFEEISSIWGLYKLEYLNFINNDCSRISYPRFFENFPNLKTCLLGGNQLGNYIANDVNGTIFRRNKFLRSVDVSYNQVKTIPRSFLNALSNVFFFNISGNHLTNMDNFYLLKQAKMINASHNKIHSFPSSLMAAMNTRIKNLSLDISHNPLTTSAICCEIDTFIKWTKSTRISLRFLATFTCVNEGNAVNMSNISESFFDTHCPRKVSIVIKVVFLVALSFVLVVLTIVLCYRKRLDLAWWFILFRRYTRHQKDDVITDEITWDAFIVYSSDATCWVRRHLETELEIKRGYKFCIHERDFTPGHPIDENIVSAIHGSRHTILLLTNSFQRSEWCNFEVKMAERCARSRGNRVIIPIVFKSFDFSEVDLFLKATLEENTYIRWGPNNNYQPFFWNVLTKALGPPFS